MIREAGGRPAVSRARLRAWFAASICLGLRRAIEGLPVNLFGGSVWESNPYSHIAKSLYALPYGIQLGANWGQYFGYSFNCLALTFSDNVAVNL